MIRFWQVKDGRRKANAKRRLPTPIQKEVKRVRHIYIRGIIGLIWLIAAIVCGVSGSFQTMGLYIVLAGVFLYFAYAAWKKEKGGKGGR